MEGGSILLKYIGRCKPQERLGTASVDDLFFFSKTSLFELPRKSCLHKHLFPSLDLQTERLIDVVIS